MDSTDQNFSMLGSSGTTVDVIYNRIEAAGCDREHGNGPDRR